MRIAVSRTPRLQHGLRTDRSGGHELSVEVRVGSQHHRRLERPASRVQRLCRRRDRRARRVELGCGCRTGITGVVKGDNVTLWATTSTSSAAADNGADPNKVVEITDSLSATTLTAAVASESFRVVTGPTYGTVYRGVAYVK